MNDSGAGSRPPSVLQVAICTGSTLALLVLAVAWFGADAVAGPSQIALVIGTSLTVLIGIRNGHRWPQIETRIVQGIGTAMPAILILFAVGALIGAWLLSGTVPTMIHYGLLLLNPALFYPAACLLCALIGLSIGSSWTVVGTLGVALIGMAAALGLSVEITAGAIVCGAYFGDKMSPLSDTTNLASAVTGVDLFSHIRHMMWTTIPGFLLAVLGFTGIGIAQSGAGHGAASPDGIAETLALLSASFAIGPLMLSPVVLVVYLAYRRIPPLAALLAGALLGLVLALAFQRPVIHALVADADGSSAALLFRGAWTVLFDGYQARTGNGTLDALLSRGGMSSMLETVWLIIAAMSYGAALEATGVLERLLRALLTLGHSVGALITTTLATCVGVNLLAADQYMSIVLPGRMFAMEFGKRGLDPLNLSRVLEDGGTLTSPLVPWNTCGAYVAAALGVPTLAYLPWCFFNLATPLISALYGFTGFRIRRLPHDPGAA